MNRGEAPLVVIGGEDLALVLHHSRERQRLAAGTGAEVEHLLAGPGAGKQRGELRALILHLDEPFEIGRFGVHSRALGVRREPHAQAPGRPARRLRLEIGELLGRPLALALERVDTQIERRA